ncbi:hypothetical protein MCOR02_002747 [Pyricularia oryzae]|nr:hypothetical protein MCOR02_002747 [Pyricularia oryzae]KAI6330952.1 hypothetical protein MCOR28_011513 [Pyricularia oryzae]KAI6354411.1 hypothetical protein MCOR31_011483 [Pyricularia oryzae]KAI6389715.1 hypothetical protein MCOR24_010528 [Pyricularia oryzae]KAI6394561.1 hypothetical protein MCOR20_010483 [Pyricularia oryzae]
MATAATAHPHHQPHQMYRQSQSPVIGHQQSFRPPHQRSLSQQHLIGGQSTPPLGGNEGFEVSPPKRQRVSMDDGRRRRSTSLVQSPAPAAAAGLHSSTPPPGAISKEMRARMSASPAAGDRKRPSMARAVAAATSAPAAADDMSSPTAATPVATNKPRRVRTGCLTCRERHLKCDEGTPDCLNCRKSNRECKRGVRLNFIDVQVKSPPYIPPTVEWSVRFEDESRAIASEYRGGLGRYAHMDTRTITPPRETDLDAVLQQYRSDTGNASTLAMISETSSSMPMSTYAAKTVENPVDRRYTDFQIAQAQQAHKSSEYMGNSGGSSHVALEAGNSAGNFSLATLQDQYSMQENEPSIRGHHHRNSDVSSVASQGVGPPSNSSVRETQDSSQPKVSDGLITPPSEGVATGERDYLNSPEEIKYMQVFVEEVGVWMDSFDKEKHFSRVIPYLALKSPMLLNAFLACGAKQLTLVRPNENLHDHRALCYYDTATTQLLRSLSNPDRNMAECATTAVVLNVYEIMSDKPAKRMNHIAGARALIRECGWNAKTKGVGSACFWLNIGMEVLSCLAFNWQTAWHPDDWGLDMGFLTEDPECSPKEVKKEAENTFGGSGDEDEEWVHRIFYIVAKIASFRANIPRFQEPSPHDEQVRLQSRFAEWKSLKALCDAWCNNCPRPMRPFGYLFPSQTRTQSAFPNVWLIKRAAVIGRLFYHTAMCLLAQINPVNPRDSEENMAAQLQHAHQVCGIVAHTKDNGIASVALRSLAIAAAVLRDRREQEEVVAIFDRITRETGWRLGKVYLELEKSWGWKPEPPKHGVATGSDGNSSNNNSSSSSNNTTTAATSNNASARQTASSSSIPQNQNQSQGQSQSQNQAAAASVNPISMSAAMSAAPMRQPPPKLQRPQSNPSPRPQPSRRSSGIAPTASPVGMGPGTTGPQQPPLLITSFPTMQQQQQYFSPQHQHPPHQMTTPTQQPTPTRPLVNPLLSRADFSLPDHPYQNWYQPPNHTNQFNSQGFWSG